VWLRGRGRRRQWQHFTARVSSLLAATRSKHNFWDGRAGPSRESSLKRQGIFMKIHHKSMNDMGFTAGGPEWQVPRCGPEKYELTCSDRINQQPKALKFHGLAKQK